MKDGKNDYSTLSIKGRDVKGNILLNGVVEHTSDDRFKHNEKIITNGLNIIRQLQPQIYQKTNTFKEADFRGKISFLDYQIDKVMLEA